MLLHDKWYHVTMALNEVGKTDRNDRTANNVMKIFRTRAELYDRQWGQDIMLPCLSHPPPSVVPITLLLKSFWNLHFP